MLHLDMVRTEDFGGVIYQFPQRRIGDPAIVTSLSLNVSWFLDGLPLDYDRLGRDTASRQMVLTLQKCLELKKRIDEHPAIIIVPDSWNRQSNRILLIGREFTVEWKKRKLIAQINVKVLNLFRMNTTVKILGISQKAYACMERMIFKLSGEDPRQTQNWDIYSCIKYLFCK